MNIDTGTDLISIYINVMHLFLSFAESQCGWSRSTVHAIEAV